MLSTPTAAETQPATRAVVWHVTAMIWHAFGSWARLVLRRSVGWRQPVSWALCVKNGRRARKTSFEVRSRLHLSREWSRAPRPISTWGAGGRAHDEGNSWRAQLVLAGYFY